MMALQWLMWCAAAAVLTIVVQPVEQQTSCHMYNNYHGVPGIPGANGPHGEDGPKGEKGDPGDGELLGRKGDPGDKGPPGRAGPKGDPGPEGLRGMPGPKGGRGASQRVGKPKSFFSYKRLITQTPYKDRPIIFNSEVVPNLRQYLRGDNLTQGEFHCNIKGFYYFTYHISARDLVCLKLMKGTEAMLTMCDSSWSHLVTSGSLVLDLAVGDRVSLQPSMYNKIITSPNSADNTFTGMLLFPTG